MVQPHHESERAAMARAVELARRGPVHGPNPRVGAVVLSADGRTLGEGWHEGAGTPHAEVAALSAARAAGADLQGTTVVVTLEPCHHTGRTGPCTAALLDAGVGRVVHAVADPSRVAGGGAAALQAAGVEVEQGVGAAEVEDLLRVWLAAVRRGRPWVTLKTASTLDGRVAAADGSSRWITSAAAREHAHLFRAEVDAIVVGTGTALLDDPALTARGPDGGLAPHQPLRVVAGDREVPVGARLRGPGGPLVRVPGHDPGAAAGGPGAAGGPARAGGGWSDRVGSVPPSRPRGRGACLPGGRLSRGRSARCRRSRREHG